MPEKGKDSSRRKRAPEDWQAGHRLVDDPGFPFFIRDSEERAVEVDSRGNLLLPFSDSTET